MLLSKLFKQNTINIKEGENEKNMAKSKSKSKKEPQTMDELLAQTGYNLHGLKKGEFLTGTISEKKGNTLYIDIGFKNEGIVTGKELVRVKDFVDQLDIGDEVEVQVRVPENERGQTLLSLRKAASNSAWTFFEEKLKTEGTITVHGREESHGGLVVIAPFGLLGFIPGSQIGEQYEQNPDNMVDKDIKVKVLEVDRDKNRLVFSERLVSEPEAVEKEEKLIEAVKEGQKFEAEVIRVEPFGLFVQVKFDKQLLDGLVHISEISWEKIDNLPGIYKIGDKINVVLINKNDGRLQFSIKRLKKDPWKDITKKYPVEKEIKGEVVRIAGFGALVRLEPGIEGLVHISKIAPDAKLEVGQKVNCYVESLDVENRRLSLGLVMTGKKMPIYK